MQYISGWEALNLPNNQGVIADWHFKLYFSDNNKYRIYQSDDNKILKHLGIEQRYIPILDKNCHIASFARAIADLVYIKETKGLKNCVSDYLDSSDELELFQYLKKISKDREDIKIFMKEELTKLYFKDKECLNHIK